MDSKSRPGPGLNAEAIRTIFTYSNPMDAGDPKGTIQLYEDTRDFGLLFSAHVLDNVPGCPEKTIAIRKMQEAVMFANAAIATQGGVAGYERPPSSNLYDEFAKAKGEELVEDATEGLPFEEQIEEGGDS